MIELVREEPSPPFYASSREDGLFERMDGVTDVAEAARICAWEHGIKRGKTVWVGWGEIPNRDFEPRYQVADDNLQFLLRCMFEYEVVSVRKKGGIKGGVSVRCLTTE